MKIDDAGSKLPNLPTAVSSGSRAAVGKAGESTASGKTDKVSLSGTLQSLSASADAPVDTAKVEKVRAAIADGSFQVDVERIADNLIASNRDLASRNK